jgi:hypothetical protein
LKIPERLTDEGHTLRFIAQQSRSDPVHRRRIPPGQYQPQRQRLGRKRAITLAGYHCIHNVKDLALRLLGHRSIQSPI